MMRVARIGLIVWNAGGALNECLPVHWLWAVCLGLGGSRSSVYMARLLVVVIVVVVVLIESGWMRAYERKLYAGDTGVDHHLQQYY